MKVFFDNAAVARLLAHALEATQHSPTFEQMCEPGVLKKDAPRRGIPLPEHVDRTKIPAGLQLVGDQGIYLMSNGYPALTSEDGRNICVYARGADPQKDPATFRELKRTAFGGDDAVEFLDADFIRRALEAAQSGKFFLDISKDQISAPVFAPPRRKAASTKAKSPVKAK